MIAMLAGEGRPFVLEHLEPPLPVRRADGHALTRKRSRTAQQLLRLDEHTQLVRHIEPRLDSRRKVVRTVQADEIDVRPALGQVVQRDEGAVLGEHVARADQVAFHKVRLAVEEELATFRPELAKAEPCKREIERGLLRERRPQRIQHGRAVGGETPELRVVPGRAGIDGYGTVRRDRDFTVGQRQDALTAEPDFVMHPCRLGGGGIVPHGHLRRHGVLADRRPDLRVREKQGRIAPQVHVAPNAGEVTLTVAVEGEAANGLDPHVERVRLAEAGGAADRQLEGSLGPLVPTNRLTVQPDLALVVNAFQPDDDLPAIVPGCRQEEREPIPRLAGAARRSARVRPELFGALRRLGKLVAPRGAKAAGDARGPPAFRRRVRQDGRSGHNLPLVAIEANTLPHCRLFIGTDGECDKGHSAHDERRQHHPKLLRGMLDGGGHFGQQFGFGRGPRALFHETS